MQTSQFTCNKCADDRNGVAYCGICNVYLCYPCVEDHARISKTMGHILLDAMHLLPFYPQELTKSKEKNRHIQTSITHLAEKCRGQTDGEFQAGDLDFEQDVGVIAAAIEDRKRLHNELTKAKAEVLQMQTNIKHLASECWQSDGGEAGDVDMAQEVGEITDAIEERKRLNQEITQSKEEIRQMLVSIKHIADDCDEPTNDEEAGASGFKRDFGVITATFELMKRLKKKLTKTEEENRHMKMSVTDLANRFREYQGIQPASTFDFKEDVQLLTDSIREAISLNQDCSKWTDETLQMMESIKHLTDEFKKKTNDEKAGESDFKHGVGVITPTIDFVKRYLEEVDMLNRLERDEMNQKEYCRLTQTEEVNLHMKLSGQAIANAFREYLDYWSASRVDFEEKQQFLHSHIGWIICLIALGSTGLKVVEHWEEVENEKKKKQKIKNKKKK